MGQESDDHAGSVPRRARRPRPADPGGTDGSRLRGVRAAQTRDGQTRLRGHARSRAATPRRVPGCCRNRPVTVLRVHRRRVPGREPAAGRPARTMARSAGRSLRGGRRLPDDLRIHRRIARTLAELHAAVPARDRHPARGELSLHTGGPRPREPTLDAARRDAEDASIEHVLRTTTDRACRAERERRGRCGRRGGASSRERGGRPARGDRGALPDQRAVRAVRGGLRRRRHPVSGA